MLWGQKERLGFERNVVNVIIITVRDKVPHIPSSCLIMWMDSTVLGKYTIAAMLPDQREPVLQQIDQLLSGENSDTSRSW